MDERYSIDDKRSMEQLKEKTFSGYKKTDVMNQVFKSIDLKKIEESCFWASECLVSGYMIPLFEKLINYGGKISINNPKLPSFLDTKNVIFQNQTTKYASRAIHPS